MRFVAAAVATLFAMAPAGASAQSWYRVTVNAKFGSYVDLARTRSLGDKIVAVTKSIYTHTLIDGDNIYSSETRSEFDCSGHSFRTLEFTFFNLADEPIRTEASETINQRRVPAANSGDEYVFQFVCYRTGGTLVSDPYDDMRNELPKYQK
jgi:hypothetical protein